MIKAVFFDIDGTLVSFQNHQVPASTWKALKILKEKGILLFIATGRAKDGLEVLNDFPFDGYITLNGQYDFLRDGTVAYQNTIRKEDLRIILEYLKEHPVPCGFQKDHDKVFNFRNHLVDEIHAITHNDDQPAGDISHIDEESVYQIMCFVSPEEEKTLMELLPNCTSARWYATFCDISPKGGTKVKGMDVFAKHFGFTMNEAMAIGDGGNDLAMLKHAGSSIAMGSSDEKLKEIADYVTADVDHDGIWQAFQHEKLI